MTYQAASRTGSPGTYIGTTRAAPPSESPGSPFARFLDGVDDCIVGPESVGNKFFAGMVFWRANTNLPPDNLVSQRLFTQHSSSPQLTRVAVGINRGKLSLVMELRVSFQPNNTGILKVIESDFDLMDTDRHRLAIWVEPDFTAPGLLGTDPEVIVFLDGKVAMHFAGAHTAHSTGVRGAYILFPTTEFIPATFGGDRGERNFHGYLDDIFLFNFGNRPTARQALALMRYLEAVDAGQVFRDYVGVPFGFLVDAHPDPGANFASDWISYRESLSNGASQPYEYVSVPGSNSPNSRAALAAPFSSNAVFPVQTAEFRITPGSVALVQNIAVGITRSPNGSFTTSHLGEDNDSYSYLPDGRLRRNNITLESGLLTWGFNDYIGFRWQVGGSLLTIYKNGQEVYTFVPGGTDWYPAVRFGDNSVYVANGTRKAKHFPADTVGMPWLGSGYKGALASEMSVGKFAPTVAALQETTGTTIISTSGTTSVVVGSCSTPAMSGSLTGDPQEVSRVIGTTMEFGSSTTNTAGPEFFFGLAFSPTAADLVGTKVLLDSLNRPGQWGIRLVSGALQAYVGAVSVSLPAGNIVSGGKYYAAITRTPLGKLLLWLSGGGVAQSTAITPITAPSLTTSVSVGYTTGGANKFAGSVSHILLSPSRFSQWKLDRIAMVGQWTRPDILAVTGEFAVTGPSLTGSLDIYSSGNSFTVTTVGGTPPPGIAFDVSGRKIVATGKVTTTGTYTWTLGVEDENGLTGQISLTAVDLRVVWTPSQLSTLVAQYDQTTEITSVSGQATQWTTSTGVLHLTTSQTLRAPQVLAGALAGGKRALRFDGLDDFYAMSQSAARQIGANKAAIWAFGVMRFTKPLNVSNWPVFSIPGASGGARLAVSLEPASTGTGVGYKVYARRTATEAEVLSTLVALNTPEIWHMWFVYLDYQANVLYFRLNAQPALTQASFLPVAGLIENSAGQRSPVVSGYPTQTSATPAFTTNPAAMDMAALLVGDGTAPAVADIDRLFGWAAHEFNLTSLLPVSHPYKTVYPSA